MWNYTAGRKVEFGAWWESKNGSFFLENAKWVLSSSGEFCSLAPLWADRLAPGYQTRLHDARLPSALTNLKPNSYSKMADFGTDFGTTKNGRSDEIWYRQLKIHFYQVLNVLRDKFWVYKANKDSESPDNSILSLSGRTGRQQTVFFRKIRTKSGKPTESRQTRDARQDFRWNLDKTETRTVPSADVWFEQSWLDVKGKKFQHFRNFQIFERPNWLVLNWFWPVIKGFSKSV